ncbi:MAG: HEAT repeat domain-containing protein [Candidatus Thorarchaeota archaeon]|nr:HEAT repeat domain-containing protein [Candidatus Thorarchaeota archaeon]
MVKKSDRTIASALGGGESVSRLKKAMKGVMRKPDDVVGQMLNNLTSIQACKDAALTGDDDLRVLAVCRLGEFGAASFDALDISLNDESPLVRTVAAGMLAYTEDQEAIEILKPYLVDNNETVRDSIKFALGWLDEHASEKDHGTRIPDKWENPAEILLDSDVIPLKTSEDVEVVSTYTAVPDSLEFGITVENQSLEPMHEVSIKVLLFPTESLEPLDPLSQIIEKIEPGGIEALIFGFKVTDEVVEGEFVTSVQFIDSNGEDVAAISGNIFVRSLFEQVVPLDITPEEFLSLKSEMKEWNREHSLAVEAKELFDTVKALFQNWNLHIIQSDSTERENVFMGIVSGAAKGRIHEDKLAVTLTIVGRLNDDLSKLRIDVLSEDPEVLHTVASVLFETIQRELGVIEMEV